MVQQLINRWRRYNRRRILGERLIVGEQSEVDYLRLKIIGDSSIVVGARCIVNGSLYCERASASIQIGTETFIGNSSLVAADSIRVGSYVLISSGCYIADTSGHSLNYLIRRQDVSNRLQGFKNWDDIGTKPVILEDHCWIGYGSIILKGVRIGKGSIIGAGSVVTKDVPEFVLCGGNPAKILQSIK